jgi:hypothetical protein
MSRSVARRYRVRIAQQAVSEITDGTVDFTLEVADLHDVPVVAGSLVHPLDGATELRPLHVLGVDYAGGLIAAFSESGRWAALGRLVDLQWQAAADDPVSDPWTTYGTGRCSGLDEADGPGMFRIEISDESWVARRGKVFGVAGTTCLWPSGFMWGGWKGWRDTGLGASGDIVDTAEGGLLVRLRLAQSGGFYSGGSVTGELVDWARRDLLPKDTLLVPRLLAGNFRHLRLRYPNTQGADKDWEIVSFGSLSAGVDGILGTLEEPDVDLVGSLYRTRIYVWIRLQSVTPLPPFYPPANTGYARLYAPTAPPDKDNPLHVGMEYDPGDWGGTSGSYGFLHVADLTRRMWDALGVRYNASSLDAIEADTTFPVVAPRLLEVPEDPERWAQEELWGPLMLLALKDLDGRRKLKDIRPPLTDEDLSALPVLDVTNSKHHRWRLVGREQINTIVWEYEWLDPVVTPASGSRVPDSLDGFRSETRTLPEVAGDTVASAGRRARTFKVGATMADDTHHNAFPYPSEGFVSRVLASGLGQPFVGDVVDQHSDLLLQVYQDGPVRGTCEVSGTLAETVEEGDYAIVDCRSVKIANAGRAARSGLVLVLLLSVTRYPAHSEVEYMLYRPVQVFDCITETNLDTWLVSPLNELSSVRLALGAIGEPGGAFALEVLARKNAAGGQQVDLGVTLYEGTSVVAEWTEYDITANTTTFTFALDSGEQASITDWDNLFVELARGGTVGGDVADYRRLEIASVRVA